MTMTFVGLDIGSTTFHQVMMRPDGGTIATRSFPMSEANLITAFTGLGTDTHDHLEAGELAPWVRGVIAPLVRRVVISHPPANAWIGKDPNKRDQLDAAKLADLLRMNRFTEVYYAEQQSRREFKQLVQHFDDLTDQQVRLKYKIKARLRAQGVIVRGLRLYTASGRGAVLERVTSPQVRATIEQLYEVLDQTLASQRAAQRLMLQAARAFPEVELFKAVPGIGPLSACRFSAYVQTPRRFSNVRKLWRYCRLGVSHCTSDGKPLSRPRLDPAGCGRLKDVTRKAFDAALRRKDDNLFKRAYERSLASTHNQTHARLSVQRKFVSVLRAMWLTLSPYRDEPG
jgi:transposase